MSARRRRLATAGLAFGVIAAACALDSLGTRAVAPPQIDVSGLAPNAARAVSDARAGVLKDSKSGSAWGRLGMACMAHDFRNEALACFAEAGRLQPRQFRWMYLSAIVLEDSDQEQAEQRFASAVALEPGYAPLRWRLGNLLLRLDRLDAAEREFEAAAGLESDSPYPLLGLAHVDLARGDASRAEGHLQKAVDLAPSCRDAIGELAGLLSRQGKPGSSLELQQRWLKLPTCPSEMPDPIRQEVFRHGGRERVLAIEADELVLRGELEQAVAVLRTLVAENPGLSRPWVNIGQLLLARGNVVAAHQVFEEAVERFPREPLAHYGLAGACEASGATREAVGSYRRACELKPDYAEAHYRLGVLLWQSGERWPAAEALERAVAAEPGLAPARLTFGLVLRDLGEIDRAREQLRAAVRLAPHDPEAACHLAELDETGAAAPADRSQTD